MHRAGRRGQANGHVFVIVSLAGAGEQGVIVRPGRVSCRVNMRTASGEPALKYSNSDIPVHLTRPG